MRTKITVIYDNPSDPATFEQLFPDQLALAKDIPGLETIEVAKAWPKEDGTPTPAHRLLDLYFEDYTAASAAVVTDEAGAFLKSVFALATDGVRIVFAAVEERTELAGPRSAEAPAAQRVG